MQFLKPVTAVLLVPVLFLTGCGSGGGGHEDAGGAATPEAAFEGFQAAMQKDDFNAGFSYLTPQSQEALLGVAHLGPISSPTEVDGIFEEALEKLAVLEKHGVNPESPDPNVYSNVNNKAVCFQDLLSVMRKHAGDEKSLSPIGPDTFGDATLTNLVIDGTTARGMAGEDPIHFTKQDGKWLIDLKKSLGQIRWGGTTFDITGAGGSIKYWRDRSERTKVPESERDATSGQSSSSMSREAKPRNPSSISKLS